MMRASFIYRCLLALATVGCADVLLPKTFGSGEIGPLTTDPKTLLAYTLSAEAAYGVMTHFWTTGGVPDIDTAVFDYFIDGESTPSISFQPAMACGQGFPEEHEKMFPPQGLFYAGEKMGKNSMEGGWYHYYKIPFQKSIFVQARTLSGNTDSFVSLRGHEIAKSSTASGGMTFPSGFQLPRNAKLQLKRIDNETFPALSWVPLLDIPAGYAGIIYQSTLSLSSAPAANDYIEGCFHLYSEQNEDFPGTVIATGFEDFYDSAFGFCRGHLGKTPCIFAHPSAGLMTLVHDHRERISAYRFFDQETVGFSNGGGLQWRVGDVRAKCTDTSTQHPIGNPAATAVRSYLWAYTWPLHSNSPPAPNSPAIGLMSAPKQSKDRRSLRSIRLGLQSIDPS